MSADRADLSGSPGRILLLNGAPRSGKSSLAHAIQVRIPGRWINLGVDAVAATLPPALMPGIGLRPGGERPDLEPVVAALYRLLFGSIIAHSQAGFDVVADLGLHEHYSEPLGIFDMAAKMLGPAGALIVGIDCAIDEIMRRRNADPRGGFYLSGSEAPPPVLHWQSAVHAGKTYDLRLDMGALSPEAGAAAIEVLLDNPPGQPALCRKQ
ncbi:chloramphenicol 3-O phosphotransferase [Devosia crocina]|uniref:Chloramphenicol 3-O phosphotransferase n=1 Tax=Devosia crocina TaxID=429728 RepID=A0A1I7NSF3_9HYPH|nr:hypothetical protein [Devosia crocina]SFV37576.1 chloramphenicol 3-O phosphotransferase [Devosia crocina]